MPTIIRVIEPISFGVVIVLLLVLGAEFLNGWTDAPNATAAAVASGVLTKRSALWLAVLLNAAGTLSALFFGAAVAHTIGTGIVSPDSVTLYSIGAAMTAIILWGLFAAYIGLPVSKSHALFASLAGVAFQSGGTGALLAAGWITILKGVAISTFIVFIISWTFSSLVLFANIQWMTDRHWRQLQAFTVMLVAFGHGWNDGLKFIGVFALVLLLGGITTIFYISPWVVVLCALVMGAGTFLGGWRIVSRISRDMVNNVYHPSQGVVAEFVAACGIGATAFFGIPMSTTHTVVSSIAGAKAAHGFHSVSWKTVLVIVQGWIATIICCSIFAYCLSYIIGLFL
ncbi:inorganic phosphate transporter [Candidatus Kaiserbacteria bacterium]|nr:inorganic phosphate transporter [Candidatus Kaiserbacteria bacterium]